MSCKHGTPAPHECTWLGSPPVCDKCIVERLEQRIEELELKLSDTVTSDCCKRLDNQTAQLDAVRGLPDEWRTVVEKLRSPKDISAVRACNYLSSAANQLQQALEDK